MSDGRDEPGEFGVQEGDRAVRGADLGDPGEARLVLVDQLVQVLGGHVDRRAVHQAGQLGVQRPLQRDEAECVPEYVQAVRRGADHAVASARERQRFSVEHESGMQRGVAVLIASHVDRDPCRRVRHGDPTGGGPLANQCDAAVDCSLKVWPHLRSELAQRERPGTYVVPDVPGPGEHGAQQRPLGGVQVAQRVVVGRVQVAPGHPRLDPPAATAHAKRTQRHLRGRFRRVGGPLRAAHCDLQRQRLSRGRVIPVDVGHDR